MDMNKNTRWVSLLWILEVIELGAWCQFTMCQAHTVLVGCKLQNQCNDATDDYGVYSAETGYNLTSLNFKKIISLDRKPRDITHDPKTAEIYIAEAGDKTRILKASPNGSDPTTVIDLKNVPRGIYVSEDKLFWIQKKPNRNIFYANLNGSCEMTIRTVYDRNKWEIVYDSDESIAYTASNDGVLEIFLNGSASPIMPADKYKCITFDKTERKLFIGRTKSNERGIIVGYDLETNSLTDVYNADKTIMDITILHDYVLFVEEKNGLKAIHKDGSKPLIPMNIAGLDCCHNFYSTHVIHDLPEKGIYTPNRPPDNMCDTLPNDFQNARRDLQNIFEVVENVSVDYILSNWELFNSMFPESQMSSTNLDVQIFGSDYISENLTIDLTPDNDEYDLKISFPENTWEQTAGHALVASVLKLDLQSKTVASDISKKLKVGSRILSMVMFNSNKGKASYMSKKIFNVTFSILPGAKGDPSCYFFKSNGKWSPKGCRVSESNENHVTCSCNHMTSFAVLMQVTEVDISDLHLKALDILTYIILPVSILCLTATIILFVVCKIYKKPRVIIHINLAASLLFAQLLFVTGINAKSKGGCIFVTFMLHYFWLVVYMWMLVEGVHLFLKVNPHINWKFKLPICTPLAWGLPAVIAFITLGAGISTYKENGPCWLPKENGLIAAFAVPALLITAVNFVILVIVIHKFLHLKANQDKSEIERVKTSVPAIAILIPLLGLTCIFGVFQFDGAATAFAYLFIFTNGLQGVFIFITQCLFDDDVKVFLKQKMSRGRVDLSNSTSDTHDTDTQ